MRHSRALANLRASEPFPHAIPNLTATLDRATPADIREGTGWYATAHEYARTYASAYGISTDAAAGIIAALSPQNGWDNNLQATERFLASDGEAEVHFHLCTERARAIYNGAEPLDALGGRKVRSFYRNIARPDIAGAVTVDRHACAVLHGTDTPTYLRNKANARALERYGVYHTAAAVYRAHARTLGILPHELQAIAWITHRRIQTESIPAEF
jgi:hypothetical protein